MHVKNKKLLCVMFSLCFVFSGFVQSSVNHKKLEKHEWVSVSTSNFNIISDGKSKDALSLARDLEMFRRVVQVFTNISLFDEDRPVKVLATKRSYTYKTVMSKKKSYKKFRGIFRETESGNYAVVKMKGRVGSTSTYQLSTERWGQKKLNL